jgi:hypothetical protein
MGLGMAKARRKPGRAPKAKGPKLSLSQSEYLDSDGRLDQFNQYVARMLEMEYSDVEAHQLALDAFIPDGVVEEPPEEDVVPSGGSSAIGEGPWKQFVAKVPPDKRADEMEEVRWALDNLLVDWESIPILTCPSRGAVSILHSAKADSMAFFRGPYKVLLGKQAGPSDDESRRMDTEIITTIHEVRRARDEAKLAAAETAA